MMIGIPFQPKLVLSRGLYDTFSATELEYVVLHEIGHYALWHSMRELIIGGVLLLSGILFLRKINGLRKSLIVSIILGFTFGVLLIQLGKMHEIQADRFAVRRMSDPAGMIAATKKFKDHYQGKYTQ